MTGKYNEEVILVVNNLGRHCVMSENIGEYPVKYLSEEVKEIGCSAKTEREEPLRVVLPLPFKS